MSSCFNDDEGVTIKIAPLYSFLIHASGNQLMYKADEKMNGFEIIESNFDSIGWNKKYIVIYSKGKYRGFPITKSLPNIKSAEHHEDFFIDTQLNNINLNSVISYKK